MKPLLPLFGLLCTLPWTFALAQLSNLPSSNGPVAPAPVLAPLAPSGSGLSTFNPQSLVQQAKDAPFRGYLYTGSMLGGLPEGEGVLSSANESISGVFIKGEPRGAVQIRYINYLYTGPVAWQADKLVASGQGEARLNSGAKYVGGFADGAYHGQGVYTYANGDVYQGPFVNSKRTGYGTYAFAGGERYEGEFVDGAMQGRGTYRLADGSNFSGVMRDSRMWQGRLNSASNVFTASFDNGVRTNVAVPAAIASNVGANPAKSASNIASTASESKSIIDQLKDKETRDQLKKIASQIKELRDSGKTSSSASNNASINLSQCLSLRSGSASSSQDAYTLSSSCSKAVPYVVSCNGKGFSGTIQTGSTVRVALVPKGIRCNL